MLADGVHARLANPGPTPSTVHAAEIALIWGEMDSDESIGMGRMTGNSEGG